MKKNDLIKENITKTAKLLLQKQGSFTIKEIADSCFVNIAAVNYHFGSKENLLKLVLQDVIKELQDMLSEAILAIPQNASTVYVFEQMLDLIYTYAVSNIGIINHLFLQDNYQRETAHILVKEFFTDSPFTNTIYKKISESTKSIDPETLKVKYMLLFSSFAIPLFLHILGHNANNDLLGIRDDSFKEKYIKELVKILQE